MDQETKNILSIIGINFNELDDINGQMISRYFLLSDEKYDEIKNYIPDLKKTLSSSFMTSLQKSAEKNQKWPLLNLVRQILSVYGYNMEPIRKSDGYTLDGKKKYKRYFLIVKKELKLNEKIDTNNNHNAELN